MIIGVIEWILFPHTWRKGTTDDLATGNLLALQYELREDAFSIDGLQ